MSVFNRVVVVIASLIILVGAVITLVVAAGLNTPDVLPQGWFQSQLQAVADATGGSVAGIIAVSVVVVIGMISILLFEFKPMHQPAYLLISSTEEGVTTIDRDSVCLLAERTAINVHSVHSIKCNIIEKTEGLIIPCRPSVALGSDVVEVGAELQTKIKEAVERLTSLNVARIDVKIKYEPVEAKRLAVR